MVVLVVQEVYWWCKRGCIDGRLGVGIAVEGVRWLCS